MAPLTPVRLRLKDRGLYNTKEQLIEISCFLLLNLSNRMVEYGTSTSQNLPRWPAEEAAHRPPFRTRRMHVPLSQNSRREY